MRQRTPSCCCTSSLILLLSATIVAVLFSTDPAYATVDWRIKLLDIGAKALFSTCGMHDGAWSGKTLFGNPWRPCFERLRPSVKTGEWDGVRSVDVDIPYGDATMKARVFSPVSSTTGLLPTMMFYHGGGFTISHYDDLEYDTLLRELTLQGNWIVIHPEYACVSCPNHTSLGTQCPENRLIKSFSW